MHFNDQFDFNGKSIKVYASGNLANLEDWNEALAVVLAKEEGIELIEEHWRVINFLRKFYFQYGVTPMVKVLIRHMTEELGKESANREHMYELFPGGPARQGSRIAGLPSPQGCIDG
ncbi:MAG: sulfurtransferase TusE [endosymbiont of Galathealinum brachiosum]|uniref:Sulfurtransferase n=1 Tax=endosymbiont of Galathealinum brachiosum TaxID=2200906 RepID=A0A370DJJ2_9GAMM|nr:MAG: sulfurtransferase TusE [endosymbiont of Galathealinum brachiosum]